MTTGELAGVLGLALALVAWAVLALQGRRLGRVERQLRTLMTGAGAGAGSMSLGELISSQGARLESTRSEVEVLHRAVMSLDVSMARTLQCVGLVRYNPFGDTGGDQSFALALLNTRGDGIVISSLHGRTATRFYAKPVKGGVSPLTLSEEEAKALKQAMDKAPA